MDWRTKFGRPRFVVLYRAGELWRFAAYGSAGNILDGYLNLPADASAVDAQGDLAGRVEAIAQVPLKITWSSGEPGWWSGEVTCATGTNAAGAL